MRTKISLLLATGLSLSILTVNAADVLTPCFLKISLYTNIPGTTVSDLTADPRYPAEPSQVRFLRSFNTRDALPNDALENFGGRIEGFITPLVSGDYHFFLRSDDSSELWLSLDDTEANAVMIAEETACCGLFIEPDLVDPATSPPIPLIAGQRYFIMVLYKSGSGGGQSTDMAQVAWRLAGDSTPAAALQPIAGTYLSTLASDAQAPTVSITQQPQSLTAAESARITLAVAATTTPTNPVCIQWQRNGEPIPGATGTNYSFFARKADNNARYRAVISVPGAVAQSSEATLTVAPDDTTRPAIVGVQGGPNRPEVTLTFSEPISPASGTNIANYLIIGPEDPVITAAVLSLDQSQVLLIANTNRAGAVYTVRVNNLTDQAVAPNTIAANSETNFTARGPWLQGEDGFVVFEAEDYDRNLDGRWLPDTTRGTPSGGVSMVNPNGLPGSSEAGTKLEYDILFTKTGTNILWFRTTGNDGNDDSGYLYLNGLFPPERPGNRAAMSTGSGLTADFTWRSTPFEGGGQMTFVIETPGLHTIGLGRREDGSFFDKFLITTDPTFNPTTFGPLGPPTTLREGDSAPSGASLEITLQPTNIVTGELSNIALRAGVTTVPAASLVGFQWQRKEGNTFVDIPGATGTNFPINRITLDWNGAIVRMRASSSGITRFSSEAQITVNRDVTPPQLLGATGLAGPQRIVLRFSEPLNTNNAVDAFNYTIQGPGGALPQTGSPVLLPNQRTVILTTDPQTIGAKYTVTVSGIFDQAATSNLLVNGVARFYSLGPMLDQGPDGLIVFEAENFDRNTDNRWITDGTWGNPSGGLSVVVPNGSGGVDPSSKLEYDLTFTQTGTHYVWYRASGPSGTDDSAWFHLDGARPSTRTGGNQASMQAFNGTDFRWDTDPQDGEPPYTIDITPGLHTIGLAMREDGTYFDKFAITTDPNFNPNNFGPLGPLETRAGMPPMAALTVTSPTNNQTFPAAVTVPLAVAITANGRTISKVEYFNGAQKIGESTTSPFSFNWESVPQGVYAITALLTDDVGDSARTGRVVITVGNPNDVLFVAASTTLNVSDAAIRDRIVGLGFNVIVMDDDVSTDLDGFGKKLIVVSSTVTSGSVSTKFRNAPSPVLTWEQANQDDYAMTGDIDGTDRGTLTNQTQVEIINGTHPMGADFGVGLVTVTTAPTDFSWGLPNANAVSVATLVGNPNRVVIYGYDTGASMVGDFIAPARRVMLFLTDNTYAVLHTDGQKLFDAALTWALGGGTPSIIRLSATRGAGGLTLQWTGGTGPYKVQKKTALTDASWVDVTTTSQTSHTVPLDGQTGFFRISQQ